MKKQIRGMIFDFGGVLGLPQKDEARQGMMAAVSIDEASFFQSYFARRIEYDRGTISRREYWTEVLAGVKIELSEEMFETLIVVDEESWVSQNSKMIDFIGAHRDQMEKLGILSNMPKDFVPSIIRKFDWISWFDYTLWSCDVHLVKPEQEIYLRTAEELGLSVADCLFIDDSMINVEGARATGMEAIHYLDFESFLEEFKANYRLE
jgi:HAD superfamily hydrolase (TIGR01509 family)